MLSTHHLNILLTSTFVNFHRLKYDHEAAKKARAAKKAAKKTAKKNKKKSSTSELFELDDCSESEVALDSLGSFLTILLTLIISRRTQERVMQ